MTTRVTTGDTITMVRHSGDCQCGCHLVAGQPGTITEVHHDWFDDWFVASAHKPSAAGGRLVEVAYLIDEAKAA